MMPKFSSINARFICGRAEEVLPACIGEIQSETDGKTKASKSKDHGNKKAIDSIDPELTAQIRSADIAILDPPRAGCREELLDAIAFAKIPNIIYVSCDPATLARDIRFLGEKGYELIEATPYDLFPSTNHVETVVRLDKKKPKEYVEIGVDAEDYYKIKDSEEAR